MNTYVVQVEFDGGWLVTREVNAESLSEAENTVLDMAVKQYPKESNPTVTYSEKGML